MLPVSASPTPQPRLVALVPCPPCSCACRVHTHVGAPHSFAEDHRREPLQRGVSSMPHYQVAAGLVGCVVAQYLAWVVSNSVWPATLRVSTCKLWQRDVRSAKCARPHHHVTSGAVPSMCCPYSQGVEPLLAAMVVWCTPDTRPRPSKRLLGSVLLLVAGLVLGTGGQGFAHGLGTLLGLVRGQ